ncbi:MAG: cysteine desulfurase NifS [Parcubacteria group bacterium GW2011_GWA2_36_24]|nr:MAG: cysteine desulfurase NifS [Parcubacteria group bacterium GW2011_GWA2_36_24]
MAITVKIKKTKKKILSIFIFIPYEILSLFFMTEVLTYKQNPVISYGIHAISIYTIFMPKSNKISKKIYPHTFQKVKGVGVYLDCASSALSQSANPGAIHELGVKEKNKLEEARRIIAKILKVRETEIIFTSGATESNNLAILGLIQNFKKPHIITTNIEHASVFQVCKYLEKTKQAEVTYVPVEANGIVNPKKIKEALKLNTVLVSVMYANNEIGTIQPIKEIAKEIRHWKKGRESFLEPGYFSAEKFLVLAPSRSQVSKKLSLPFFHTDATQAVNYLPISVPQLGVDLMSFNSAKIYGPKGVGALYVKKNVPIRKIMFGGDQEFGLRPGTENVALSVEFAKALQVVEKIKEKETKRLIKLRDYFIAQLTHSNILTNIGMILNGDRNERLPNNINITIPNIPSDLLVIELSARGIMASAKSACKSGDGKASYVIKAIHPEIKETDGSLRFS